MKPVISLSFLLVALVSSKSFALGNGTSKTSVCGHSIEQCTKQLEAVKRELKSAQLKKLLGDYTVIRNVGRIATRIDDVEYFPSVDYWEAENICKSQGMRLPTLMELLRVAEIMGLKLPDSLLTYDSSRLGYANPYDKMVRGISWVLAPAQGTSRAEGNWQVDRNGTDTGVWAGTVLSIDKSKYELMEEFVPSLRFWTSTWGLNSDDGPKTDGSGQVVFDFNSAIVSVVPTRQNAGVMCLLRKGE